MAGPGARQIRRGSIRGAGRGRPSPAPMLPNPRTRWHARAVAAARLRRAVALLKRTKLVCLSCEWSALLAPLPSIRPGQRRWLQASMGSAAPARGRTVGFWGFPLWQEHLLRPWPPGGGCARRCGAAARKNLRALAWPGAQAGGADPMVFRRNPLACLKPPMAVGEAVLIRVDPSAWPPQRAPRWPAGA